MTLEARRGTAAAQLSGSSDSSSARSALERLTEQLGASDIVLWSATGKLIASAGKSRFDINPDRPSAQQLRSARSQGVVTQVEGVEEGAESSAGVSAARIKSHGGWFRHPGSACWTRLVSCRSPRPSPAALVANAISVQEANREYQERALGREGLRRMYIGTLTLSLFLAVFGAVLLAVVLGNQLARPLLLLAEGVRQVAAGDLTPKAGIAGQATNWAD
jgi:nitrogen fixation/metabolism regulation signal transduction histidine kinase